MTDFNGYAVFFFPQALEALGGALKPYLQEGPAEPHVLCREIDAGGPLIQLTMDGRTSSGQSIDLQLILPTNMIRMIVSARSDPVFGFGPRTAVEPVPDREAVVEDEPGPAHAPEGSEKPGGVNKRAAKKSAGKGARKLPQKPAKKAASKAPKKPGRKPAGKAGGNAGKKAGSKPAKKTAGKATRKTARKK
jgi:hypothetical protein